MGAAAQEVWEVRVNETKSSGRLYLHLASTGGFGIIQNIPVKQARKLQDAQAEKLTSLQAEKLRC